MFVDNAVYLKYFTPLLPSHNYNTRNTRINLPGIRIELEKISTIYNICNLINEVPSDLLIQQSKYSLKKKFYSLAIDRYNSV